MSGAALVPMPIGDIADWLHPRASQSKALALLRAYFDESGTHDTATVTAIGGYVGTKSAWCAVEDDITRVIGEFAHKGVRSFHMSHCLMQTGEFALIDKPCCNYIITQISESLGRNKLQQMFVAVVTADWDALVTDPVFLKRLPKPFHLCFDGMVRVLWEWSAGHTGGEKVVPMFAHHPEYGEHMKQVGEGYGSEAWYRKVLGPIAFGHPEDTVPLQAADMVINQLTSDMHKTVYGPHNVGPTQALWNATGRGRFTYGHWFAGQQLRDLVERYRATREIWRLRPSPY